MSPEGAPVRFALVGSSGFAAAMVAPAILQSHDAELVGVLGSTPERGAALTNELGCGRAYRNLDDMLGDATVDAVWITAHDPLHAPLGVASMNAGKHVI